MKTTILLDHEPVADGGFLVRALLRLEGEVPSVPERVPLNLSLVLDRSGSMSGPPLRAARQAAAMLVRRLRPEDVVSVVAYDDHVTVVAKPATGEQQEHLTDAIASIQSGGSTNLSGGWLEARDLVASRRRDGGVNRIILLTDGLANVGITDPETLVGLCRTAAEAGIGTTTLGFGPGFNEDLLKAMADAGGGGTYYIEHVDETAAIFGDEIEGLLSISAQNVRVRVRPGTHAESARVLHGYPSHSEDRVLTVEVGDLYAREPRRLLLEVLLSPDAPVGSDAEVAELEVTAHVLTAEGGVELQTISIPVTLSPEHGGRADPVVRKEVLLLETARARDEAVRSLEIGDFEGGHVKLRAAISHLTSLAESDPELLAEIEDLNAMEQSLVLGEMGASDIKHMKQISYHSHRSRSTSHGRKRPSKDPDATT